MRVDLTNAIQHDWAEFISNVLARAIVDHRNGRKRVSGHELVVTNTSSFRKRHERLASTVYNQYRDELETRMKEKRDNPAICRMFSLPVARSSILVDPGAIKGHSRNFARLDFAPIIPKLKRRLEYAAIPGSDGVIPVRQRDS